MPTERFQFTGEGGHQLAAALDLPERKPAAYALFAHCFTCGKDVLAAKRIAVALAAKGIAVLRFDFTGLGSSEGDFANSTFSSNVTDLVRAADHLREPDGGVIGKAQIEIHVHRYGRIVRHARNASLVARCV